MCKYILQLYQKSMRPDEYDRIKQARNIWVNANATGDFEVTHLVSICISPNMHPCAVKVLT